MALGFAEIDDYWGGAESSRFDCHVEYADGEPDSAGGLGKWIQIPPDDCAKDEAHERQNDVDYDAALAARYFQHAELPESRQIHTHEREKGSEIQQFAGLLVSTAELVQELCSSKAQQPNQNDVVGRRARSRRYVTEEFARQHIVAAHAEQQFCRSQAAGQSAAECGENQNDSHGVE